MTRRVPISAGYPLATRRRDGRSCGYPQLFSKPLVSSVLFADDEARLKRQVYKRTGTVHPGNPYETNIPASVEAFFRRDTDSATTSVFVELHLRQQYYTLIEAKNRRRAGP